MITIHQFKTNINEKTYKSVIKAEDRTLKNLKTYVYVDGELKYKGDLNIGHISLDIASLKKIIIGYEFDKNKVREFLKSQELELGKKLQDWSEKEFNVVVRKLLVYRWAFYKRSWVFDLDFNLIRKIDGVAFPTNLFPRRTDIAKAVAVLHKDGFIKDNKWIEKVKRIDLIDIETGESLLPDEFKEKFIFSFPATYHLFAPPPKDHWIIHLVDKETLKIYLWDFHEKEFLLGGKGYDYIYFNEGLAVGDFEYPFVVAERKDKPLNSEGEFPRYPRYLVDREGNELYEFHWHITRKVIGGKVLQVLFNENKKKKEWGIINFKTGKLISSFSVNREFRNFEFYGSNQGDYGVIVFYADLFEPKSLFDPRDASIEDEERSTIYSLTSLKQIVIINLKDFKQIIDFKGVHGDLHKPVSSKEKFVNGVRVWKEGEPYLIVERIERMKRQRDGFIWAYYKAERALLDVRTGKFVTNWSSKPLKKFLEELERKFGGGNKNSLGGGNRSVITLKAPSGVKKKFW